MTIPPKPKGGSLDLLMKVTYHFPYMRRPILKGEIAYGVAYDYAINLIQKDKAVAATLQTEQKVDPEEMDRQAEKAKAQYLKEKASETQKASTGKGNSRTKNDK